MRRLPGPGKQAYLQSATGREPTVAYGWEPVARLGVASGFDWQGLRIIAFVMVRPLAIKAGAIVVAFLLYYAIQFPAVWAGLQNPWNAPPSWLENGAWLYMTVHHVVQALLALLVIAVLSGFRFGAWGLNLDNARASIDLVKRFTVWFGVIIAVGLVMQLATGATSIYDGPLRLDHMVGGLFFMWVVSGVSEEILFRGLFQTWFARFWSRVVKVAGVEIPVAGIVAAIFFAVVHINFSIITWEITHFSPMQIALAFVLGLFYAVAYHKTGSLLAPALAHNIANGLMETSNLTVALAN